MLKKILIGLGVLIVLAAAGFGYLNHRNRTLSPPGELVFSKPDAGIEQVKITYSRPSVKGRLIFGDDASGALQPFGAYWRLGANEGTELETSGTLEVEGNKLEAGTYKVYCYPGPDAFEFAFAQADGAWGYSEPDREKELFTIDVPVKKLSTPVEQYTIRIEEGEEMQKILFEFSDYQLPISFKGE